MYCGHIGIALGAKGLGSKLPILVLAVAAFGPDWVETAMIAAAARGTPALSHSVPAVVIGAAVSLLLGLAFRRSHRDAAILGALYVSHLLVDFLTGRKPLGFHGPLFGAGLYHYPLTDFAIEASLLTAGWILYVKSLQGPRSFRRPAAISLIVGLIAMQAVFDWKFTGG